MGYLRPSDGGRIRAFQVWISRARWAWALGVYPGTRRRRGRGAPAVLAPPRWAGPSAGRRGSVRDVRPRRRVRHGAEAPGRPRSRRSPSEQPRPRRWRPASPRRRIPDGPVANDSPAACADRFQHRTGFAASHGTVSDDKKGRSHEAPPLILYANARDAIARCLSAGGAPTLGTRSLAGRAPSRGTDGSGSRPGDSAPCLRPWRSRRSGRFRRGRQRTAGRPAHYG